MKKLIIANWKQLPETEAQAEEILSRIDACTRELDQTRFDLVVCPPMVFLDDVAALVPSFVLVGAQDMDPHLTRMRVRYVIIGHSSRRAAGESDAVVNEKLTAALHSELVPIVCVENVAQAQALSGFSDDEFQRIIIAYEPAWAISTNPGAHPDTPENASEVAHRILGALPAGPHAVLYGGSVIENNVAAFLSQPIFSGVLVGGASVRPDEFCRILSIVAHL